MQRESQGDAPPSPMHCRQRSQRGSVTWSQVDGDARASRMSARRMSLNSSLKRLASARSSRSSMSRRSTINNDRACVAQVTNCGEVRKMIDSEATFASLFLSGTTAMILPARSSTEMDGLACQAFLSESLTSYPDVAFFPEPPCILPFEGDCHDHASEDTDLDVDLSECPQTYWKAFAIQNAAHFPDLARQQFANTYFNSEWLDWKERKPGCVQPFVNISPDVVEVRRQASMCDTAGMGQFIQSGVCVLVQNTVEKESTRYFELVDATGFEHGTRWIPERRDHLSVVMAEMKNIEVGAWWHRVICKEHLYIRRAPVYDERARTILTVSPGELFVVDLKCQVRGWRFVRLADGRGWLFVMRPGVRKDNTDLANTCLLDLDQEILQGFKKVDFRSLLPPTNKAVEVGRWIYAVMRKPVLAIGESVYGTYLSPGEVVKVDKRAYELGDEPGKNASQRLWLRLQDGRGWVPQVDGHAQLLVLWQDGSRYPSWYQGEQPLDDVPEEIVGFV